MLLFNLVYYSLYIFAGRTGHRNAPEDFAWIYLSGLVGLNILFLLPWVSALCLPDINLVSKNSSTFLCLSMMAIFYLYYIRKDRYKTIVAKYNGKSEQERKMIFAFGIAYVVLSIAFIFFTTFFARP